MGITADIIEGKYDDELDAIYQAYRTRSKMVVDIKNAVGMTEWKVGDKARLVQNIKPKSLAGQPVKIVRKNAKTFTCEADDGSQFPRSWNVPAALLEKVSA